MTFLLPIVFFSIFAMVFGGPGRRRARACGSTWVVDEDDSEVSTRLLAALAEGEGPARCTTGRRQGGDRGREPLDRARAPRSWCRAGSCRGGGGAEGFGTALSRLRRPRRAGGRAAGRPLRPDRARRWSLGLLQKVAMTAMPDLFAAGRHRTCSSATPGRSRPQQRQAVDQWEQGLRGPGQAGDSAAAPAAPRRRWPAGWSRTRGRGRHPGAGAAHRHHRLLRRRHRA